MNFCMWSLPDNINKPAKNEQNPPSDFGDRPIATAWQPESEWGPGGITHVCDVTASRHCPHDVMTFLWRHRCDLSFRVCHVIVEDGCLSIIWTCVLQPWLWVRSHTTLSVWAGQSQCGNPIGSELVSVMYNTIHQTGSYLEHCFLIIHDNWLGFFIFSHLML